MRDSHTMPPDLPLGWAPPTDLGTCVQGDVCPDAPRPETQQQVQKPEEPNVGPAAPGYTLLPTSRAKLSPQRPTQGPAGEGENEHGSGLNATKSEWMGAFTVTGPRRGWRSRPIGAPRSVSISSRRKTLPDELLCFHSQNVRIIRGNNVCGNFS